MHCLSAITNIDSPLPWKWSESYLNVGQRAYHVFCGTITEVSNKTNWCLTALKILSYFTIVLPLFALAVRAYYRSKYFEGRPVQPQEKLADRASFMKAYKKICENGEGLAIQPWWHSSAAFAAETVEKASKHYCDFLQQDFKVENNSQYTRVLDQEGHFTSTVRAIQYAQLNFPDIFAENLSQLKAKLDEIHTSIDWIFEHQPTKIFRDGDACFASEFYSFLTSLEVLERILTPV